MRCIGLTGRIGCGKSTAAHWFQTHNIPVISADEINHQLLSPGNLGYKAIQTAFPKQFTQANGHLDRGKLRQAMLKDATLKSWLEKTLHPLIREEIKNKIKRIPSSPYCIIEIPLLLDRSAFPYLERVVLIDAPVEVQKKRLIARDNQSETAACRLIELQAKKETYLAVADEVIVNDADLAKLEKQLKKIHQTLLKM